ncbi:MAG TPA: PIN domain-containing protein [Ilumatobacteraceae bacterium]|nr:PIN domain-containing protein [Ilumatobacteraceae bacterium]
MILLDAYAVLALLKDEPAAADVATMLEREECTLTSVGVAEILDHLVRVVGADAETAVLDLAQLGLANALPIDDMIGTRAGLLQARHYHRAERAVSLADCVLAAAADHHNAPLATADPHLLALCNDEGISYFALPDSNGHSWGATRKT